MEKPQQLKSKLVKVRADSLRVHPKAQRDIIPSKVKKLMEEMDLDAIGVLHVVEYAIDGQFAMWIIDGQHRWRALMDLGLGEWMVEVKVHLESKTDSRASALFLKLNDRALVNPYSKYTNELNSGKPEAVGVQKIIDYYGLKLRNYHEDGCLTCPASLKKTYRLDDGKSLKKALGIIGQAWGTKAAALEGKIIEGLGGVVARYDGVIDRDSLVKKMSKYPGGPSGLIGDARGILEFRKTSMSRCISERLIETYNKGRRIGLLDPV